jgi:hypothetical protein
LNLKRTLGCFQSALELHQERVADRFDFRAAEARENGSQNSAVLLPQFESERFVPLRERGVPDHVAQPTLWPVQLKGGSLRRRQEAGQ